MLFVKMLKFSKKQFFFQRTKFCEGKSIVFWNIQIFNMESSKSNTHSINMRQSCPCTMYYCIWQMQARDLAVATTTFLQLFLLHEICKLVLFQSKESFKVSLSLSYENLDFILRFSTLPL